MKNYDENDPIKEVSRKSIFSKLNSFEDDYEYELEKEMKEYEKQQKQNNYNNSQYSTGNSYQNYQYNSNSIKFIIAFNLIIFATAIIFTVGSMYSIEKRVEEEERYVAEEETSYEDDGTFDSIYMAKLSSITFDEIGSIPALYRYDKNIEANWCEYTYSDDRFGGASTLEINYNEIPAQSMSNYVKALNNNDYKYIGEYSGRPIYLKEEKNDYFLFVVVSEYRIIYGAGIGDFIDINS